MRIVSQDRALSIDFDGCEIRRLGAAIVRRVGSDNEVIGEYETPERAAEVFEDMHEAYAPVYSISNNMTEEELRGIILRSRNVVANNILNFGQEKCLTTYSEYVYYMPEK